MSLIATRYYDLAVYDQETDPTPLSEIVTVVDHHDWDKPKRAPYIDTTPPAQAGDLTKEAILALLEVSTLTGNNTGDQDLSGKVDKVTGSGLMTDDEKNKLALLNQNVYTITLPAVSGVAAKCAGGIAPSGWTLAADSVVNLSITHNLSRRIASVEVYSVSGASERMLKPFSTAYSGVLATSDDVLIIEGYAPTTAATVIHLIFA